MKHFIKVKGQEWPLDFSMTTLALFARDDGKNLSDMLSGMQFDLLSIIRLLYWAVKSGCEKEGKENPFDDWKKAGDWIDEEPQLAGVFLSEYYRSQGLTITDEESDEVGKLKA